MILIACILVLFTPLACLGLNRMLPTRMLMFGSAALFGLATLLIIAAAATHASGGILDIGYIELSNLHVRLLLEVTTPDWAILIAVLGLAAASLFGVGLALPNDLRGFAGVPGAFTLLVCCVLIGVVNQEPLITPFLVMVAVFLCSITLRASGGIADSDAPLIILLAGACACILLLATQSIGGTIGNTCFILACLLLIGSAPFGSLAVALSEAPAGLGGALLGIGLPILGGHLLMRHMALHATDQTGLLLTILGIVTLFAGAARALAETHGRPLIAWQHGAQYGLFLVAIGQGEPLLTTLAPLLLIMNACSTLGAAFAIASLERRGGSDELAAVQTATPVILPGLALLIAGGSAIGMPGTIGMLARITVWQQLNQAGAIWASGLLLAGSGLLALSYVAPLASLWRGINATSPLVSATGSTAQLIPGCIVLPLLMLAVYPQLISGIGYGLITRATMLVIALVVLGIPLLLIRRMPAESPANTDEQAAGTMLPTALGESVAGLAWLAAPASALNLAWVGLLQLSQSVAWLFGWIERRYYLAGLTIALIVIIFIFL